jgi:hypothetical protein
MEECRYRSSHSSPRHEMGVGGELYAPDVLPTVGLRAGLNLWRTENNLPAVCNETKISRSTAASLGTISSTRDHTSPEMYFELGITGPATGCSIRKVTCSAESYILKGF